MRQDMSGQSLERRASDHMAQSIRMAFCNTMTSSGLPPMTILRLAAVALGVIYKEAVAAHRGPNGCPCGWQPEAASDMDELKDALAVGALTDTGIDLRFTHPAGRA